MKIVDFEDFTYIIGDTSMDLFNHYHVDTIDKYSKADVDTYEEVNHKPYISILTSNIPNDTRPFVFINKSAYTDDHVTMEMLLHELIYLSTTLHDWRTDNEDQLVNSIEERAYECFDMYIDYKQAGTI